MSRARVLLLLVAVASAIVAALLARGLLRQQPAGPAAPAQVVRMDTVPVLLAAKDIIVGERITAPAVEWRDWPRDNVASTMITRDARPDAPTELQQSRARQPILAGEPISERKLVQATDRFVSATLPQGMRAISIAVTKRSASGGFILPGDRVDVLLTRSVDVGKPQKLVLTQTVITNVRVLAMNQVIAPEEDKFSVLEPETAVLELDPKQAETVTMAEGAGDLSLALRSLAEGGDAGLTDQRPALGQAFRGLNDYGSKAGPNIIRYGISNANN